MPTSRRAGMVALYTLAIIIATLEIERHLRQRNNGRVLTLVPPLQQEG